MAENSFIAQRQFANAQGARFTPVTPAMPQPYKPSQDLDIQKLYNFMKTGADKFYDYSFKQGQLNQLAGTYEKGKYSILSGAYQDGAKYAKATNDLGQAKADIQQILNDGLATGESSQSVLNKIQQRTAPIADLAQDFLKTHPEAANTMLSQVQGIQAQSLQSYALGEQNLYHQRVLAADSKLAQESLDTALTTAPRIIDGSSQYIDPKWIVAKNRQLVDNFAQSRVRAGSQNPFAEASALLSTAWKAQLVNANMNVAQHRALVNSIPHITSGMVQDGSMTLEQAYQLNSFARGKINEAQQSFKAAVEDTLQFAPYSKEAQVFLEGQYKKWTDTGGDPMQVHRWRKFWVQKGNKANQDKALLSGAGITSGASSNKIYNALLAKNGGDTTKTNFEVIGMWDDNATLAKVGAGNLYNQLQMILPTSGTLTKNQVDNKMHPTLATLADIMSNTKHKDQDKDRIRYSKAALKDKFGSSDQYQFLQLYADKMLADQENGTYSHAQVVRAFQEFHKGRQQLRLNGQGAFKVTQENFQGWKIPFTDNSSTGDLNPIVASSLASEYTRNASTINAINWSAKQAVVFDPDDPKTGLQNGGYYSKTDNGYIVAGNAPLSMFSADFQDTAAFLKAIQEQAKYTGDRTSGFNRKVDSDTCYVWYDAQTNNMRIVRQDGSQNVTTQEVDMQKLRADYHRITNQKAKKIANSSSKQVIADIPLVIAPDPTDKVQTVPIKGNIDHIEVDGQRQLSREEYQRLYAMKRKYDPSLIDNVSKSIDDAKSWMNNVYQTMFQKGFGNQFADDVNAGKVQTDNQDPWYRQAYNTAMKKYQEFKNWAISKGIPQDKLKQSLVYKDGYKLTPTMAKLVGVENLSFEERTNFVNYCKERVNGTIGVDGTVYPQETDIDVIQNVNDFVNADPMNPYKAINATVFYKYWNDYKKQRDARAVIDMSDDVISTVNASDGQGGYNTFQITKASTLGAYGPNLGPKALIHLAEVQGFILTPRLTNPKASDKPVVGLGYVAGYPAWNKRFKQAQGDPVKLSQVTNEFFTWYTSNIPSKFSDATGLNFKELRTNPDFETTAIAIADYAWHAGRNASGYYDCLKMVRQGNVSGALNKLYSTEAYKESQKDRQMYLVAGLLQFDTMLKELE